MAFPTRILVVDGALEVRESLSVFLESVGYSVKTFAYAEALFRDKLSSSDCLVAHSRTLGMDALQLQEELVKRKLGLPFIITTEPTEVALCARAMAAGARDFLERPYDPENLLRSIEKALLARHHVKLSDGEVASARAKLESLTLKEHKVLDHLIAGLTIGAISGELHEPPSAIELHRSRIMTKLECTRLAELVRITLSARRLN